MKGKYKPRCARAMANEISRIFQVIRDIQIIDICFLIHSHNFTQYSKVTYCRIVFDIRPHQR